MVTADVLGEVVGIDHYGLIVRRKFGSGRYGGGTRVIPFITSNFFFTGPKDLMEWHTGDLICYPQRANRDFRASFLKKASGGKCR